MVADKFKTAGSVMVTDTELVHPFASLIPMVWVPAANESNLLPEV